MFQRIKALFADLTIYGLGDVVTSIVSFLLLPIYVRYLSPADYGIIALLLTVEVVAKIVFRWGVDASFMRLYYDCPDQSARQRLASTIFFALLGANGLLLIGALALAPLLARHLFGIPGHTLTLELVLLNTFVMGFYFIPFHVLRIMGRPGQFVALSIGRSTATIAARLVLVIVFRLGVLGVVLADVAVTAVFTLILSRWFAPLIRPIFSWRILSEALRFGLPRVPHGVAHQVIAIVDRYLLSKFVTLGEVGLYSIGASFGLALKLFLSAFEYAWAPFYFGLMKEPDAKQAFSAVTTYGVGVLVLLTTGLSAVAGDLVRLATKPEFYGAAPVVPWVAMGVSLQGIYLLTSIGLNITKRTGYYPVCTGLAAVTSVVSNLLLIPRFGILGAAWSNVMAYGVLAATSMWFSQRFYPIAYEWPRIAKLLVAGGAAYVAATRVLPGQRSALAGVLVRGSIVVIAFPAALVLLGFFADREVARARRVLDRLRHGRRAAVAAQRAEPVELAGELAGGTWPEQIDEVEIVDTCETARRDV